VSLRREIEDPEELLEQWRRELQRKPGLPLPVLVWLLGAALLVIVVLVWVVGLRP